MDELTAMEILTAKEIGLRAGEWKHMYSIVMSAASRALDLLVREDKKWEAYRVLEKALLEAEEYYISVSGGEAEI